MKVLVCDKIAQEGIDILKKEFDVEVKLNLKEEEIIPIIEQFDSVIVRSATNITKNIIDAGVNLKAIGRAGVGVDNIDVQHATQKGILVMNTPGGNMIAAAEHTLAMMLSLSRKIAQADLSMKHNKWDRKKFTGVELKDKKLGIIGIGRIGNEVAKRARSFEMEVIAYDPFISKENFKNDNIELVSLDELISTSDYISIHAPLTDQTKYMINKNEFEKMKNNVRIINCARGGIINEKDLNWALENKLIEGAALDVFEKEPITDSPLLNHDNIITTPHLGASTEEAQINVAISLANDLIRALKTGAARNSVNMPYIKSDEWKKIKPYVKLAEKLGSFYSQFKNGRISSIKLDYSGEIAGCNSSIITSAAIKGLLDVILQEPVNIINSQSIANKRNIKIIESKNDNVKDYGNLVVLEVESDKEIGKIGGTVFENNELRIVLIDDYKIDLVPEGHMLLISHNDKPGMIGRVGNILGNSDINIATMQVGRKKPRGEAIMSLSVDEPIDNETLKEIEKIEGLEKVRVANIQ